MQSTPSAFVKLHPEGDLYARTNIEEMVADVSPFLFYPADEKKIRLFLPIVEQADLG